jgi:hypothetical protein
MHAGLVVRTGANPLRFVVCELNQAPDRAAIEFVPLQAVNDLLGDFNSLRECHECAKTVVCLFGKCKSKDGTSWPSSTNTPPGGMLRVDERGSQPC